MICRFLLLNIIVQDPLLPLFCLVGPVFLCSMFDIYVKFSILCPSSLPPEVSAQSHVSFSDRECLLTSASAPDSNFNQFGSSFVHKARSWTTSL